MTADVKRILLADDDLAVLEVHGSLLARPGVEIRLATSGNEAKRLVESGYLPDLIISDLNMPDGSGIDLLRFVRANEGTRRVPLIIVSGSSEPVEVRTALAEGCTVFLRKPVSLPLLEAEIAACLAMPLRSTPRTQAELQALLHGARRPLEVQVHDFSADGLYFESPTRLDVRRGYRLEILFGGALDADRVDTEISLVRETTRRAGKSTVYGYGAMVHQPAGGQ